MSTYSRCYRCKKLYPSAMGYSGLCRYCNEVDAEEYKRQERQRAEEIEMRRTAMEAMEPTP
jgi:hypothetical protein